MVTRMAQVHFEVYRDVRGYYRWRLVGANGEIVSSGEGYSTKQGAINAIHWIALNGPGSSILDRT